ncbi:MAG: M24 family metallopeptidase [Paraclostridium sp.]
MNNLEKIKLVLEEKNLDAIYISNPENVNYISKYSDEAAFVLITKKNNYLITDTRFMELAQSECTGFEIINWHLYDRSLVNAIKEICIKESLHKLAFEQNDLVFAKYNDLNSTLASYNVELIPTENIVEELRYVKNNCEIDNIRKACEIADKALEDLIPHIKIGAKESDLAAKLEYYLKLHGAQQIGFETILVSGAKSSLLHGKPNDKVLENGDFLIIDYGAKYNGYISDTTRTFIIGSADEKQIELYNMVLEAQLVGIENMGPGVHATKPDDEIRKVVKKFEDNYYRGLGHGVGRNLHEEPFLGNYGTKNMEAGCVITMEPGIYFPGWGGVRIEDTVLVTENGYEILTKFPKELTILDPK